MKLLFALVLAVTLSACAGNGLHKPTTVGNAGTTALVAYFAANQAATKYIALPRCATPPVYPCSTQAIVDKVAAADTAAYNAALAADSASATQAEKHTAQAKIDELKKVTP